MKIRMLLALIIVSQTILCGCSPKITGTLTSIDNHCISGFPDRLAASRVISSTLDDRGGTGYQWDDISRLLNAKGGLVLSYNGARLYLPETALHGGGWRVPFLSPQKIAIVNDGRDQSHTYYAFLKTRPDAPKPVWYSFHSTDSEGVCHWIPL